MWLIAELIGELVFSLLAKGIKIIFQYWKDLPERPIKTPKAKPKLDFNRLNTPTEILPLAYSSSLTIPAKDTLLDALIGKYPDCKFHWTDEFYNTSTGCLIIRHGHYRCRICRESIAYNEYVWKEIDGKIKEMRNKEETNYSKKHGQIGNLVSEMEVVSTGAHAEGYLAADEVRSFVLKGD